MVLPRDGGTAPRASIHGQGSPKRSKSARERHENLSLTRVLSDPLSTALRILREFAGRAGARHLVFHMSVANDQRESASDGSSAKRRRETLQHVRDARDRLTSTTGTRSAFDYELLRQ